MSGSKSKYVLDANVFIEASRNYYPFDFARPFWDNLEIFAKKDLICSVDHVFDELKEGKDNLAEWVVNSFSDYFETTQTEKVLKEYIQLVQWAEKENQYSDFAKDEFMEGKNADPWLLAFCNAHDYTLVTHEVGNAHIKRKIPMPNVAEAFEIDYCNTFEMLRGLRFKF